MDRTGCAWLIRNFVDPEAEFSFAADADELPEGTTGFDMRGVELTHHGEDCSFETILKRYELEDPALWAIAPGSSTRPISRTIDSTRLKRPGSM